MKPLVSVIVTTKNNEKIIARCLQSISNQSYKHLELVVVDNFSTDRTPQIAKKFTSRVYTQGPERSAQRNFGARKARGRYALFIDSDMELQREVVMDCVKNMKGCTALVVPERFMGEGFWAQCKILEKSSYTPEDGVAARFFIKKEFFAVGGYDEALTGPEDIDLHKRIAKDGKIGLSSIPITHHDGRLALSGILKKRYYYSLSLRHYMKKHHEAARREFRLIRPAYLQNWRRLIRNPVFLTGMLVMRIMEGGAALLALWRTRQ